MRKTCLAILLSYLGGGVAMTLLLPGCSEPAAPASEAKEEFLLEESQRKFLWDVEHHVLLFKKHAVPELTDAIQQTDDDRLQRILAESFEGLVLQADAEIAIDRTWGTSQVFTKTRPAKDNAQFAAWLLDERNRFADSAQVRFTLRQFAPPNRDCEQHIWAGDGHMRIYGDLVDGGVGETVLELDFEVARPTQDIAASKGWLHRCDVKRSRVSSTAQFTMREVAAERGIDIAGMHDNWTSDLLLGNSSGGVYVADYDRDGRLDLFVTDYNENKLYRGVENGRFEDATEAAGLANTITGGVAAVFSDLDGDGWVDLIIEPRIYRNVHGQRFEEVTKQSNLRVAIGSSGISTADFDRDGRMDLYVTAYGDPQGRDMKHLPWDNDHTVTPVSNQLWRNLGDWQFEEVAEPRGATGSNRSVFASIWLHANNDDWPDLYVINELGHGVLLVNNDGQFTQQKIDQGAGDHGSMGVTAGDIDGDGATDIYVANMYSNAARRVFSNIKPNTYSGKLDAKLRESFGTGSRLYRSLGNLKYGYAGTQPEVAEIGWVYGPAMMDLDNNGWLDIYACSGFVSRDREKPDG